MNLKGTGVALVTPFVENGDIDFVSLETLINYNIEGGVDYLVVMGTTAESATLSKEEKTEVINFTIKINKGRLPLVLGIGGNNTKAVVEEIIETDLTNFDALLSVSPFYSKPSQEGIYQHFKKISENCPIDIILYNVPGRTSSDMSNDTILRLANNFENIVAVKEASGSLVRAMELISEKTTDFHVISGDDALALPMTLMGGSGVISVIAQAVPQLFSTLIKHGLNNDASKANILHYEVLELISLIFEEGNPSGIKSALKSIKICSDFVRLPLISSSNSLSNKIDLKILRLMSVTV